ncbi:putative F-box domain-containing protein [Helianthus annuus]|nr:putative F-box domain-containing protein [Helianthus annuus]
MQTVTSPDLFDMETLEEESTKTTVDPLKKTNANISLPTEVIEEILSRLPVKSILRFRSLSKPWLSRISNPSFTKLQFTRATAAHRSALFIFAFDGSTHKRHLLSSAHDGGPVTHLMTLHEFDYDDITAAQHLNGLVSFSCEEFPMEYTQVFVVNPSTHKIFKLPQLDLYFSKNLFGREWYVFVFDESEYDHKILIFRDFVDTMEIMIYSMSNYSWRKIIVEPPIGFTCDLLCYSTESGVCVNSVVHLMLIESYDILEFDLRTEKFSIIKTPQGVKPHESNTSYFNKGFSFCKDNIPRFIKINGCIGVVCHDLVVEKNEMHIWILQDYENRVWVREIVTFPKSWKKLGEPFPADSVNTDEVIFVSSNFSRNHAKSVSIYNRKNRCFKYLQFTPGHQFSLSRTMRIDQIGCYVESMVPL